MLKFFFKMTKNRFLRGQGAEHKMAQKHGQNVIFSFCTEEKVDKKWSKPSHLSGVGGIVRKGPGSLFSPHTAYFLGTQRTSTKHREHLLILENTNAENPVEELCPENSKRGVKRRGLFERVCGRTLFCVT